MCLVSNYCRLPTFPTARQRAHIRNQRKPLSVRKMCKKFNPARSAISRSKMPLNSCNQGKHQKPRSPKKPGAWLGCMESPRARSVRHDLRSGAHNQTMLRSIMLLRALLSQGAEC
jgi:hypothetical protein